MMGRRLAIFCLLFALGGMVTGVTTWAAATREGAVNRLNFRRIQIGMSEIRVEQLLGGPGEPDESGPHHSARNWSEGDCSFTIIFDETNHVKEIVNKSAQTSTVNDIVR